MIPELVFHTMPDGSLVAEQPRYEYGGPTLYRYSLNWCEETMWEVAIENLGSATDQSRGILPYRPTLIVTLDEAIETAQRFHDHPEPFPVDRTDPNESWSGNHA